MKPTKAAYGMAVMTSCRMLRCIEGAWKCARPASNVRRSGAATASRSGEVFEPIRIFMKRGLAASGFGRLRLGRGQPEASRKGCQNKGAMRSAEPDSRCLVGWFQLDCAG